MKFDEKLNKMGNDLGKTLSADNMYRNFAYLSFSIVILVTFFLSLANAEFDFSKILEAQFWIDFSVTLFGSLFLKYVFGKYGNTEGHKNLEVINAMADVNAINKEIQAKDLSNDLKLMVDKFNDSKKIKALKNKTYHKLLRRPNSKYWNTIKNAILLVEKFNENNLSDEENKVIIDKLDNMNFSIDAAKVKYNRISEASLQTGIPSSQNDDEKMTFSEFGELFGKQIYMTIFTLVFTILLASSSIMLESFSLITIIVFLSRVFSFAMNAFTGFTTSKRAVEVVKLNVLKLIYVFLKRFVEITKGREVKDGGEEVIA